MNWGAAYIDEIFRQIKTALVRLILTYEPSKTKRSKPVNLVCDPKLLLASRIVQKTAVVLSTSYDFNWFRLENFNDFNLCFKWRRKTLLQKKIIKIYSFVV